MRAYLKKCLVLILPVLVFSSACRKSNTPEGVSRSSAAYSDVSAPNQFRRGAALWRFRNAWS